MAFTITADSTPVYDTWGFADYWNCHDWITWHKLLLKKYGKEKADSTWAEAWVNGVSKAGGGKGTAPGSGLFADSVPVDCRTFNQEFKDYISASPVLKDAVFSGVLGGTVGKATSTVVNTVKSVTDSVDNAASGLSSTTKMLKWIIPLLLIIILVGAGVIVYKKYIDA